MFNGLKVDYSGLDAKTKSVLMQIVSQSQSIVDDLNELRTVKLEKKNYVTQIDESNIADNLLIISDKTNKKLKCLQAGTTSQFLRGDGSWQSVPSNANTDITLGGLTPSDTLYPSQKVVKNDLSMYDPVPGGDITIPNGWILQAIDSYTIASGGSLTIGIGSSLFLRYI
jgi:hypothetical protein